jgi:hypothetical protein
LILISNCQFIEKREEDSLFSFSVSLLIPDMFALGLTCQNV